MCLSAHIIEIHDTNNVVYVLLNRQSLHFIILHSKAFQFPHYESQPEHT